MSVMTRHPFTFLLSYLETRVFKLTVRASKGQGGLYVLGKHRHIKAGYLHLSTKSVIKYTITSITGIQQVLIGLCPNTLYSFLQHPNETKLIVFLLIGNIGCKCQILTLKLRSTSCSGTGFGAPPLLSVSLLVTAASSVEDTASLPATVQLGITNTHTVCWGYYAFCQESDNPHKSYWNRK